MGPSFIHQRKEDALRASRIPAPYFAHYLTYCLTHFHLNLHILGIFSCIFLCVLCIFTLVTFCIFHTFFNIMHIHGKTNYFEGFLLLFPPLLGSPLACKGLSQCISYHYIYLSWFVHSPCFFTQSSLLWAVFGASQETMTLSASQ